MERSMTPAGWLSGADLVYRIADTFHEMAEAGGRPPLTGQEASTAALAALGIALSQPTPPLAAFVRQGEWFMVPSRLWMAVVDSCEGGDTAPLATALLSPTLPAIFAEYAGQPALFGYENATVFISSLRNPAAGLPVVEPGTSDAPWLPGSISAWLGGKAAGEWANEKLRQQGLRVDERGRRNEFAKAIEQHRAGFAHESIAKTRNRSGYTIAKGV